MEKTHLSEPEIEDITSLVIDQITFISEEEFSHKNEEVFRILENHKKDALYLAL